VASSLRERVGEERAQQVSDRPQKTICEGCREWIEPDEPVIVAREIKPATGFGPAEDGVPGLKVVFHEGCFDESHPNYQRG
jgi:hypothetical protein